ncbi:MULTISPECIES: Holliday junction branch migration protein RuvA [Pedobacter]|uniref:Holliday junction branch migration protein RuvA n=1 Tax=Pedobacter TaxID=84567 RepID=UPI00210E7EC4|nr:MULTISPECIES: Holliday junction branch migration protein RuvA [unclassified Pedobacter]
MFAYIDGKLTFKCPAYVVVEAGGVGYHINISLSTYSSLPEGERCKIYTWLHVKEDAHTLYGFADEDERRLFLHLISVSGIGPNTGRMMLSSITPTEIQAAIIQGDLPLIQRIKGIGAKSAQRLVLELQDKLKKEGSGSLMAAPVRNSVKDEAIAALVMLGFSKPASEKALVAVEKVHGKDLLVEQMIKLALKNL